MTLLLPQESYKQKVLHKLLEDKLISKRQKDGVKGYRLMRKGKEGLLQLDQERFSFYLEDGADFSMRKSTVTQRKRQHRIAETLIMMEKSGTAIYRDEKKTIFGKEPLQTDAFTQSAFFHPKEVKEQIDLTRKIISSRITGVWVMDEAVWLCYNIGTILPAWFDNVENRADILIRSMIRETGLAFNSSRVLLFGSSMQQATDCLENDKMRGYIRNAPFQKFCFLPLDSMGCTVLQLLNDPEIYQCLLSVLSEDLEKNLGGIHMEYDGNNPEGLPTLICIDCDLKRLTQFITQLRYIGRRGEVICFDFQKEAIKRYCGEETKISTVDLETVRTRFLAGG